MKFIENTAAQVLHRLKLHGHSTDQ